MTPGANTSSEVKKPEKAQVAVTKRGSMLSRYQDVVVGSRSLLYTLYYEFCMWLTHFPGALGLLLRKIFWPRLFGHCGKGTAFAEGIVLRHPKRIHLGKRVVVSERCILDARSTETDRAIVLSDDVILSNDVVLSSENGAIRIGDRTGIGAQTIIHSRIHCGVRIGKDVLIAPRCFMTGGGSYNIDRLDIPISQQGKVYDGGITIEDNVWLATNVSVLGGVAVGSGSVAAAGAVITKSIERNAICMGIPAKVTKTRTELAEKRQDLKEV